MAEGAVTATGMLNRTNRLILFLIAAGILASFAAVLVVDRNTPRYLVWGSEIKALLASGLIERELNVDGLAQFLCWEYVPGRETLLGPFRSSKRATSSRSTWRTAAPSRSATGTSPGERMGP